MKTMPECVHHIPFDTPCPACIEDARRQLTEDVQKFLNDLRDPEVFGHAVTLEVRRKARDLSRTFLRLSSGV